MTERKNIVIIGASGQAKVIIDIVEKEQKYHIAGLLDKNKRVGEEVSGYKILGDEPEIPKIIKELDVIGGLIAVGDNWTRKNICERVKTGVPDFEFVSAIHPGAQIGRGVEIGEGTVIMAGAIVNPDSTVGNHCILNTNSSLDHDCLMEDYSSLAPNATAGGNVSIGRFSAISLGANIIHGIKIEEHCVVGAGAVVLENIPGFSVVYGIPAKVVRKRKAGEKYL